MRINVSSPSGTIGLRGITMASVALIFLAFSFALGSCGRTPSTGSVALDFAPGYPVRSNGDSAGGFAEEGTVVLRCASLEQSERGMMVTTSKSKDMKASVLVFLRLPAKGDSSGVAEAAWAPIKGKEYEYDMTRAGLGTLTLSSAAAAMKDYGIQYSDWLTGACNSSEKFPCCE